MRTIESRIKRQKELMDRIAVAQGYENHADAVAKIADKEAREMTITRNQTPEQRENTKGLVLGFIRACGPMGFKSIRIELHEQDVAEPDDYIVAEIIDELVQAKQIRLYDTGDGWDAVNG